MSLDTERYSYNNENEVFLFIPWLDWTSFTVLVWEHEITSFNPRQASLKKADVTFIPLTPSHIVVTRG